MSVYGREVVCLPVGDSELVALIPDAGAHVCMMCQSDSSATSAEYILWMFPRSCRPYIPICGNCLARLVEFFRAFP